MDRDIHPLVRRAANGVLPDWARVGAERRAHMGRVAELLAGWAERLRLAPAGKIRWRALGFLHDALRDAEESDLRRLVRDEEVIPSPGSGPGETGESDSGWTVDWEAFARPGTATVVPGDVLHGPATALRLREEGVTDSDLLSAVAYHTAGHPALGTAGRALYCADFLEPGRPADDEGRAALRDGYPDDPEGVLRAVLREGMRYLLEKDRPIFLGTVRMWNHSAR